VSRFHTDSAIIGEMNGKPTVTGSMLAFAERLQRVAPPSGIVVAQQSKKLLAGYFELESLGQFELKGFEEQEACFLVRREREFERKHSAFSGRDKELGMLSDKWQSALSGLRSVALITGVAGVGKSRLVREFRKSLEFENTLTVTLNCNQLYQHTPLYPVAQAITAPLARRGFSNESAAKTSLEDYLSGLSEDFLKQVNRTLGALSLITQQQASKDPDQPRDAKCEQMIQVLIDWLSHVVKKKPALIIVEDIDQVDPSTWELITKLASLKTDGRFMILLTLREGQQQAIPFDVDTIQLEGLVPFASRRMINSLDIENTLPKSFRKLLIMQSDGVPLYLEELAAMMLERSRKSVGLSISEAFSGFSVPDGVQGLLTVRLAGLGPAKRTAQIAAAIGRIFSLALLQQVSGVEGSELAEHIRSLEKDRLVVKITDDQYKFSHALMSDAAYDSLVKSDKVELHKSIASTMEAGLGEMRFAPEILAHHFTMSKQRKPAIKYSLLAGQSCKRRSAQAEAIHHLSNAFKLIEGEAPPYPRELLKQKLLCLSAMAPCQEALGGYGCEEAKTTYLEAEQLALMLRDDETLMLVRFGLTGYYMMRGDFNRASNLSELCWNMAQAIPQSVRGDVKQIALAQSAFSQACVMFHRGNFGQSIPMLDKCLELCKAPSFSQLKLRHDPVVMCHLYKAWYLSEENKKQEAAETVARGVAIAKQARHPFGVSVALAFQACIHLFNKEYEQTIAVASESMGYSEEPGYLIWLAWAKVLRGRAQAEVNECREQAIAEIEEGLDLWDQSGSIVTRPFALTLLAEAHHLDGQIDQAQRCINLALETVDQFGERYYFAEILRVSGELIIATLEDQSDSYDNAKQKFEESKVFARDRGMTSAVLKASISLARLHWDAGQEEQAILELKNVYSGNLTKSAHADEVSRLLTLYSRGAHPHSELSSS